MAIIQCPECGGKVSTLAPGCPHCGYVIPEDVKEALLAPKPEAVEESAPPAQAPIEPMASPVNEPEPTPAQPASEPEPAPAPETSAPEPEPTQEPSPEPTPGPTACPPPIPSPIVCERELRALDGLEIKYQKMTQPGALAKLGGSIGNALPQGVKDAAGSVAKTAGEAISGMTEQQLFQQVMGVANKSFNVILEQSSRFSLSDRDVIRALNRSLKDVQIESLEDIRLLRSYEIAKVARDYDIQHLTMAFAEGGATGVAGLAGIPFNLALSTFLYYRAVQSIALFYGYDVKNNPEELEFASQVTARALDPTQSASSKGAQYAAQGIALGIRDAAKKGWVAMAQKGGAALQIAQMRALANAAARKALDKAGRKGLEKTIFTDLLTQVGKRLSLKTVQRAVPVISAGIGAFMDTAQMNTVVNYAGVIYHTRFINEKRERILEAFSDQIDLDSEDWIVEMPEE